MDDAELVLGLGEAAGDAFVSVHEVFHVKVFAFVNQGVDHIDLATLGNLFFHEVEEQGAFGIGAVAGDDRLAAGGKFVDDGAFQVGIEGHGQSPGDGGCGHDEYVWWNGAFAP